MTAARRGWKPAKGLSALVLGLILGIAVCFGRGPAGAATTERLVVDRHTGLALYGFDPVAYFTDGEPLVGRPEFEFSLMGAVWRFRNEGNRAAFRDHPDVYIPAFGGHDVLAVARGAAVPGNPRYWIVRGRRLYLFENPASRDAFAADRGAVIAAAQAKWPELLKTLVP
ncbi:MAG TPA: YHS domain-containing (seleno)protein [Xanthobacteraceae bacterium]|nr:YHS domain-containing (seleno)protein [Xanthobacteraceae bacterium]